MLYNSSLTGQYKDSNKPENCLSRKCPKKRETMGRRTKLTPEMQKIITAIYSRHPDWSVRDIEGKIPQFSKQEIGRELSLDEVPGRTLINRYKREVLEPNLTEMEKSGIDTPWSIYTLSKYEIPAEALMTVLEILFEKLREKPPKHITIREAMWIGRLAHVIKDNQLLWRHAYQYAEMERMTQITGVDLFAFVNVTYDAHLYKNVGGKMSMAIDFVPYMFKQAEEAAKNKSEIGRSKIIKKLKPKEVNHERSHRKEG